MKLPPTCLSIHSSIPRPNNVRVGWNAPRKSLLLVHPDGAGSKATNSELNISFTPTPDYAGIAKAAAGGKLWAGSAGTVGELEKALAEAVESVKGGVGAVLEVELGAREMRDAEGKEGGGKAVLVG